MSLERSMNNRYPNKQQQILDAVTEIKTVVIGVPGTDDRGIAGSINDLNADHKELSAIVGQHSEAISRLCAFHEGRDGISQRKKLGLLGGLGAILAGAAVGLFKTFARGSDGG